MIIEGNLRCNLPCISDNIEVNIDNTEMKICDMTLSSLEITILEITDKVVAYSVSTMSY